MHDESKMTGARDVCTISFDGDIERADATLEAEPGEGAENLPQEGGGFLLSACPNVALRALDVLLEGSLLLREEAVVAFLLADVVPGEQLRETSANAGDNVVAPCAER